MPRFDYFCEPCKLTIEIVHTSTDKPAISCPKCKHKMAKQLGTFAGFKFKGSGFYETDYKRKI